MAASINGTAESATVKSTRTSASATAPWSRVVAAQAADHLNARHLRQPGHHGGPHLAVGAGDQTLSIRQRALPAAISC